MKKNAYLLNTMLAAVLGLVLLAAVVIRAVAPIVIIPRLDIPNMVLLSLVALLLEHYTRPNSKRNWIAIPVLAMATFGVLPWAACFVSSIEAVKLAVAGALVFTVVTWLFTSIQDRLSSGPVCKAAPVISAFGLYLACQCFMGMTI